MSNQNIGKPEVKKGKENPSGKFLQYFSDRVQKKSEARVDAHLLDQEKGLSLKEFFSQLNIDNEQELDFSGGLSIAGFLQFLKTAIEDNKELDFKELENVNYQDLLAFTEILNNVSNNSEKQDIEGKDMKSLSAALSLKDLDMDFLRQGDGETLSLKDLNMDFLRQEDGETLFLKDLLIDDNSSSDHMQELLSQIDLKENNLEEKILSLVKELENGKINHSEINNNSNKMLKTEGLFNESNLLDSFVFKTEDQEKIIGARMNSDQKLIQEGNLARYQLYDKHNRNTETRIENSDLAAIFSSEIAVDKESLAFNEDLKEFEVFNNARNAGENADSFYASLEKSSGFSSLENESNEKNSSEDQMTKNLDYSAVSNKQISDQGSMPRVLNNSNNDIRQEGVYNQLENQIENQFDNIISSGKNQIEINLEPESLGKVRLNVELRDGRVSVNFNVENSFVKEQIEQNLYQLRNNFLRQGYNVDHIQVETDIYETAYRQGDNPQENQQNPFYQQGEQNSSYNEMTAEEIYQMFLADEETYNFYPSQILNYQYLYQSAGINYLV